MGSKDMSFLHIRTTSRIQVTDQKLSKLCDAVGKALCKDPLKVVASIFVQPPGSIYNNGSSEPCAYVIFKSIGNFCAEKNDKIYSEIEPTLSEVLELSKDKIKTHMVLLKSEDVCTNGMTVMSNRNQATYSQLISPSME